MPDAATPRNLRAILIPDAIENVGMRKIGMRRSATDPDVWDIYISAHNYGSKPKAVNIALNFRNSGPGLRARPPASQKAVLAPGTDSEIAFQYRTAAGGILGVYLTPHDAFPADDHADLETTRAAFVVGDRILQRARVAEAAAGLDAARDGDLP